MNLDIVFGLKAVRISVEAYLYTGELTVDRPDVHLMRI